ncbi:hypothetical protein NUBL22006_50210 [Klebsiella pneumoniae]|nr:hypothetical protein NUBL22006_50210 [Klebsiella pneumoniae]
MQKLVKDDNSSNREYIINLLYGRTISTNETISFDKESKIAIYA